MTPPLCRRLRRGRSTVLDAGRRRGRKRRSELRGVFRCTREAPRTQRQVRPIPYVFSTLVHVEVLPFTSEEWGALFRSARLAALHITQRGQRARDRHRHRRRHSSAFPDETSDWDVWVSRKIDDSELCLEHRKAVSRRKGIRAQILIGLKGDYPSGLILEGVILSLIFLNILCLVLDSSESVALWHDGLPRMIFQCM